MTAGTPPLLDPDRLADLAAGRASRRDPFRHAALEGLLRPQAFERLRAEYPPLDLFERHVGLARRFGQTPHDRLYLELETSHYHEGQAGAPGVIRTPDLSPTWQQFIGELREAPYLRALQQVLGGGPSRLRFTWHVAFAGCSVSPHRDAREKRGTHLFYFNSEDEWLAEWGGATLLLGRRTTWAMNPGFDEFDQSVEAPFLGNRSLIFRNQHGAWHGVRPLTAPPGAYRKLFAVVADRPATRLPRLLDSAEAVGWRLAAPVLALGAPLRRRA